MPDPPPPPPPPSLRVAILGAAAISRKTAPAILAAGHTIASVSSRSLERAQAVVDACSLAAGGTVALGSHAAALADAAVTAVYIPAPAGHHVPLVSAAAAAGKHILLEKPISLDEADLASIVSAVADAGVVLFDGTMWVHHPRAGALAAGVLPSLGPLKSVHATLAFYGGPRFEASDIRTRPGDDGLGCVGDLGWYCVRAGLWAFGGGRVDPSDPPASVTAHAGAVLNAAGVPLTAGATALWPDGRYLSFDVSFQRAPVQRLEIAGTDRAVSLSDFVLPDNPVGPAAFSVAAPAGAGDPDALPDVNPLTSVVSIKATEPQEVGLWRAFGAAVAAKAAGDGGPAADALAAAVATQRVLNAVMESLRAGGATVAVVKE